MMVFVVEGSRELAVALQPPTVGCRFRKAAIPWAKGLVLECSGDLVSRLSNGPYGVSYGLPCSLMGDTK